MNPPIIEPSVAVLRRALTLATHAGIKTYNRTFKRIDNACYLAGIVVRLRGQLSRDYAAEIDATNQAVDHELARLAQTLNQRQAQWAKRQTLLDTEVSYTQPTEVVLSARTPAAARYARLLEQLEAIARLVDRAWYGGALKEQQRLSLGHELYRNSHRATQAIERLAVGLAGRVSDQQRVPNRVYQAMLQKRLGVAPTGETPLTDRDLQMSNKEYVQLAATGAMAEALEQTVLQTDAQSDTDVSATVGEGHAAPEPDSLPRLSLKQRLGLGDD